jgi:hypothetical protein
MSLEVPPSWLLGGSVLMSHMFGSMLFDALP